MNQKNLWIALITLIVAIFVFAQVYILFTVTQIGNQISQLETRMDKRFTALEARLDKRIDDLRTEMNQRLSDMDANIRQLNQNYSNHLAHHLDQ